MGSCLGTLGFPIDSQIALFLSARMHTATIISVLAVVGETVIATPLKTRSSYALKETHDPPRQWTRVGAAPADHVINLQIGLQPSQFAELERHLYEGQRPSPYSVSNQ